MFAGAEMRRQSDLINQYIYNNSFLFSENCLLSKSRQTLELKEKDLDAFGIPKIPRQKRSVSLMRETFTKKPRDEKTVDVDRQRRISHETKTTSAAELKEYSVILVHLSRGVLKIRLRGILGRIFAYPYFHFFLLPPLFFFFFDFLFESLGDLKCGDYLDAPASKYS